MWWEWRVECTEVEWMRTIEGRRWRIGIEVEKNEWGDVERASRRNWRKGAHKDPWIVRVCCVCEREREIEIEKILYKNCFSPAIIMQNSTLLKVFLVVANNNNTNDKENDDNDDIQKFLLFVLWAYVFTSFSSVAPCKTKMYDGRHVPNKKTPNQQ